MSKEISKAQAIREYNQEHPRAKAQTIVNELAKQNITVTRKYVTVVLTRKKPKGRSSSSRRKERAPYPQRSLEEALKVPTVIREENNGNPWVTDDVAKAALGVLKSNKRFYYIAAASRDYGLTLGSRDTEKIELADLGRAIFFAGDEQTKRQKMIDTFFSIDLFKKVYEYYGNSNLPDDEFLDNVLQNEFGLAPELHREFTKIFKENCKFLGIENGLDEGMEIPVSQKIDQSKEIKVVGQPKGKFDRTAFVIMPFSEKEPNHRPKVYFEEVLNKLITPAGNSAGFSIETAEGGGSDVIQSTIISQLLNADLVIADLTDHNPNVLFELGIRIAKELPVALIKADGTGGIFDVDNMMRVFTYDSTLWPSKIETDMPILTEHIKAAWDNSGTYRNYMQILTGVSKAEK